LNSEALLQSRYTELLEKRIAQLELVIDATEKEVIRLKATKESAELDNSEANDNKPNDDDSSDQTVKENGVKKKTVSVLYSFRPMYKFDLTRYLRRAGITGKEPAPRLQSPDIGT
jgi:septal ring factor EnvC (AmiA/AmiB activator)